MKTIHLLLITIIVLFSSCTFDEENIEKTLIIASAKTDCVGAFSQDCLLVKENRRQDWKRFYGNIVEFTYEEGFEYVLVVSEKKIVSPLQDLSTTQKILIKVVSKVEKTSKNLPL